MRISLQRAPETAAPIVDEEPPSQDAPDHPEIPDERPRRLPQWPRSLRSAGVWTALAGLALVAALFPPTRPALSAFAQIFLLLLAGFLVTVTRTVRWGALGRIFAGSLAWSLAVGAVTLSFLTDPDSAVAEALWTGLGRESLALLPLAALALAAPQWVRRFAVGDWLLLGFTLGLALQAVQELGDGVWTNVTSAPAPSPGSAVWISTAVVSGTIGLALVGRQRARSAEGLNVWFLRGLSLLAPVVAVWLTVSAPMSDAGLAGDATVPLPLRLGGHVVGALPSAPLVLLAVSLLIVLLVDARHLLAADVRRSDLSVLPVPWLAAWWAETWAERFSREPADRDPDQPDRSEDHATDPAAAGITSSATASPDQASAVGSSPPPASATGRVDTSTSVPTSPPSSPTGFLSPPPSPPTPTGLASSAPRPLPTSADPSPQPPSTTRFLSPPPSASPTSPTSPSPWPPATAPTSTEGASVPRPSSDSTHITTGTSSSLDEDTDPDRERGRHRASQGSSPTAGVRYVGLEGLALVLWFATRIWRRPALAACALIAYAARDKMVILAAHAGVNGESRLTRLVRGRAAMEMVRHARGEAYAAHTSPAGRGRMITWRVSAAVIIVVLVAGLWWAHSVRTGATVQAGWLTQYRAGLEPWWSGLMQWEQGLLVGGAVALVVLSTASLGPAFNVCGAANYLTSSGYGAATFVRSPRAALSAYLRTATPGAVAADAAEVVLTFVPITFGGAVDSRAVRATTDNYLRAFDLGGVSGNLTRAEPFSEFVTRAAPAPGYYDVVIQADRGPGGAGFSPRAVARLILKDAIYAGGPVRLITGRSGGIGRLPAQALADRLGVDVLAPSDTVFAFDSGRLVVGPSPLVPSGQWVTFKPGAAR